MNTIKYTTKGLKFKCLTERMKKNSDGYFYIPDEQQKEWCGRCSVFVKGNNVCRVKLWIMNTKMREQKERMELNTRAEHMISTHILNLTKAQEALNTVDDKIKEMNKVEKKLAKKNVKKESEEELVRKEMMEGKVKDMMKKKANRQLRSFVTAHHLSTEQAMTLIEDNKRFSGVKTDYDTKSVEMITDSVETQQRILAKLKALGDVPTLTIDKKDMEDKWEEDDEDKEEV